MTKASMTIILGSVRDIPLDKLTRSQANVRRIKAGISVDELAEDIARRGLLSALTVRPIRDPSGAETGRFEVPAGGRRFQALQRLVKAKRLAKTAPVPCIVKDADTGISAADDSLAENTHRVSLHPLDQFRAFQQLADEGQSDVEIAAHWFVTPAVVRQRLRLAAVSPALLERFAEDALTLDQLMAFTVTTDHARQEQVYAQIQTSWNKEPYYIRSLLTQGAVSTRDRRVRYLGADAYQAAGGQILRDLFTAEGDGWAEDALLLDRLVLERLQGDAHAIAAEGWRWVEVALDFPYGHQLGLRRLAPIGSGLSDAEEAQRAALQAELDQLEADYADSPDDLPEAVDRRLGEIEAELDRLGSLPAVYDADERARAGVFVSLGSDARMRVERGFVRPADEAGAVAAGEADDQGSGPDRDAASPATLPQDDGGDAGGAGLKPLPERLTVALTAYRTLALRDAVSAIPDVAFTLLLHKLVRDLFGRGSGSGSCLDLAVRPAHLPLGPADHGEGGPAASIDARHAFWEARLPVGDDDALWTTLAVLSDDERMLLLAHCVGSAVNARWEKVDRHGAGALSAHGLAQRLTQADRLAGAVSLDLAASGWRPTVANYLGHVSKAHILAAVGDGAGDMAAQLIDHLKKPDMAREAERLLADSGWVPGLLQTPGARSADVLPDFLTGDGDADAAPLAIAAE